jgi:hypothetical protein
VRGGDPRDRRAALAPRLITVYRTDADPRTVDLSLDPTERPYGSLFGRRPDLINYGLVGLGRLTTPDAWLALRRAGRPRRTARLPAGRRGDRRLAAGPVPARAAGRVTQSGICQGICGSTRPVSSSVFRLDSTADQPPAAIRRSASSARSSWVTVNRTISP